MKQQDLENFKFQSDMNNPGEILVHNGENHIYGAGAVILDNGNALSSDNFTSCIGIISYTLDTRLCTLTHIGSDFPDEQTQNAWVNWMNLNIVIDPATTIAFLAGNKDNEVIGKRIMNALYSVGLVSPMPIRPQTYAYQSCDITCDATGLHIIYHPVHPQEEKCSINIDWPGMELLQRSIA